MAGEEKPISYRSLENKNGGPFATLDKLYAAIRKKLNSFIERKFDDDFVQKIGEKFARVADTEKLAIELENDDALVGQSIPSNSMAELNNVLAEAEVLLRPSPPPLATMQEIVAKYNDVQAELDGIRLEKKQKRQQNKNKKKAGKAGDGNAEEESEEESEEEKLQKKKVPPKSKKTATRRQKGSALSISEMELPPVSTIFPTDSQPDVLQRQDLPSSSQAAEEQAYGLCDEVPVQTPATLAEAAILAVDVDMEEIADPVIEPVIDEIAMDTTDAQNVAFAADQEENMEISEEHVATDAPEQDQVSRDQEETEDNSADEEQMEVSGETPEQSSQTIEQSSQAMSSEAGETTVRDITIAITQPSVAYNVNEHRYTDETRWEEHFEAIPDKEVRAESENLKLYLIPSKTFGTRRNRYEPAIHPPWVLCSPHEISKGVLIGLFDGTEIKIDSEQDTNSQSKAKKKAKKFPTKKQVERIMPKDHTARNLIFLHADDSSILVYPLNAVPAVVYSSICPKYNCEIVYETNEFEQAALVAIKDIPAYEPIAFDNRAFKKVFSEVIDIGNKKADDRTRFVDKAMKLEKDYSLEEVFTDDAEQIDQDKAALYAQYGQELLNKEEEERIEAYKKYISNGNRNRLG